MNRKKNGGLHRGRIGTRAPGRRRRARKSPSSQPFASDSGFRPQAVRPNFQRPICLISVHDVKEAERAISTILDTPLRNSPRDNKSVMKNRRETPSELFRWIVSCFTLGRKQFAKARIATIAKDELSRASRRERRAKKPRVH